MHGEEYLHLTPINVAKYKQYYYNMLNNVSMQKNEYKNKLKGLKDEIICIEKQISEIDSQLKNIYNEDSELDVDIYYKEYNLNKLIKEEIMEGKDSLLFSKRYRNLENNINNLKIQRNILIQKRELLIEKKKLLKKKKKRIKKDISVINTNIKRNNNNSISISDTLQKLDEASIIGISYLKNSKIKPKIKEMKKIKE